MCGGDERDRQTWARKERQSGGVREYRVRKERRKRYSKGDEGGRTRASENEAREGERERERSFPTLGRFPQWTRLIPVLIGGEFQRTCSLE